MSTAQSHPLIGTRPTHDTDRYLKVGTGAGTGSGTLRGGGSYVTLRHYGTPDFSIVVEKVCRRGGGGVHYGTTTYTYTATRTGTR